MDRLIKLVEALNKSETTLLLNHYKFYYNGANKQRFELFILIKDGMVKNDLEASQRVINGKPNSNFAQLKKRLKEDIVNILLHQESTAKSTNFNVQATLECRKYLSAGELLLARGAYDPALEILKKALKLSEKFELFPERILISQALCSQIRRTSTKDFFKYLEIIEESYEKLDDYLKAYVTNIEILQPGRFSAKRNQLNTDYVNERIKLLEDLYRKTNSPKIGVSYYKSLINQLGETDQEGALIAAEEFMDLIKNNQSVYVQSTVAGIHFMMSGINISLENFEEGELHSREAIKNFKKGFMNELASMDSLFRCLFYKGELQEAVVTCDNALKHKQIKKVQSIPGKWSFYKANALFMLGDHDEAWRLLQTNTKLLKDRSGWLLGHKLLELLILIDQVDMDLFPFRFETFARLLRSIKTGNIERYKAITKIIRNLFQHGFNFEESFTEISDLLEEISAKNKELQWDANSFELCRFENWFHAKMKEEHRV